MEKITQEKLNEILDLHKKWTNGEDGGKCADLSNVDLRYTDLTDAKLAGANLTGARLRGANLRGADLAGADLAGANLVDANLVDAKLKGAILCNADLHGAILCNADLRGADLRGADLCNAALSYADLRGADLCNADLRGANLSYVNLRGAILCNADLSYVNLRGAILCNTDLCGANLTHIRYNNQTSFFALQCPEEGSFIGYKKVQNKIVKLLVTEDAKRSSATTRKCRCSKAKVLSITNLDGSDSKCTYVKSNYDLNFIYTIGEIVEVPDFDEDRWNECSTGIHFFITRDEAVQYI